MKVHGAAKERGGVEWGGAAAGAAVWTGRLVGEGKKTTPPSLGLVLSVATAAS